MPRVSRRIWVNTVSEPWPISHAPRWKATLPSGVRGRGQGDGFLFVYVSPRVVINRDVTDKMARRDGAPSGTLTVTTNAQLIAAADRWHREKVSRGEAAPRRVEAADPGYIGINHYFRQFVLPRSDPPAGATDAGAKDDLGHGVFEIKDFYRRFVRFDHVPASLAEWRALPETFLATATKPRPRN